MGLYTAMNAGVSGLAAHSTAMAGVADNISNVNTVGYKGVRTEFRTMVTDGALKNSYSAGGVLAAPQALVSRQGLIQASGGTTDLAVDGAGFFVVRDGSANGGDFALTRAGAFKPDKQGYLRNTSGFTLQGWRLDATGGFTNTGALGALEPIRLTDLTGTARPTTKLSIRANLAASGPVHSGAYAAGDMATGAATPHFSRGFDVYDAQGSAHRITAAFLKTGPNTWAAEVHATPPSDVSAANGLLASGTVRFNPDGSLDRAGSDPALFAALTPGWTNGAGAEPITLALGENGGLTGLTQFGDESGLLSSDVDGGVFGEVAAVEVGDDGRVSAVFEDGTVRAVFQLPLATVPNPDGLTRLSGNAYELSDRSGALTINAPSTFGAGAISAGALEASTVDLAAEFTDMIRFQRAYSASSKIITTVDDMLQEVSNLKR